MLIAEGYGGIVDRLRELSNEFTRDGRYPDARICSLAIHWLELLSERTGRLATRQQELLEVIWKLGRDAVSTDEAEELRGQIAALIARVVPLRAEVLGSAISGSRYACTACDSTRAPGCRLCKDLPESAEEFYCEGDTTEE